MRGGELESSGARALGLLGFVVAGGADADAAFGVDDALLLLAGSINPPRRRRTLILIFVDGEWLVNPYSYPDQWDEYNGKLPRKA